jgi:hypothetical protein
MMKGKEDQVFVKMLEIMYQKMRIQKIMERVMRIIHRIISMIRRVVLGRQGCPKICIISMRNLISMSKISIKVGHQGISNPYSSSNQNI